MASLFRRILYLLRRSRHEADLRAEIEAHRALRQATLERGGLAPHDAQRTSRRALGNVTLAREDVRSVWTWPRLEHVLRDLRGGVRALGKSPAVTVAAVASLALGIGANTAVFSLVSAILLRPLPYPSPVRLVMVKAAPLDRPDRTTAATAPEYLAWQARATLVESFGTEAQISSDLGAEEDGRPAERIAAQAFTASMFQVLGVRPALGRLLTTDEDRVDAAAPVVLISDALWQRRYGRDPLVIGRPLRVDGVVATIVGVMPPDFGYLDNRSVDVWRPLAFNSRQVQGSARGFTVAARLKPGVTIAQAQAEMDAIAAQLAREFPARQSGWGVRVVSLHEALFGSVRQPLLLFEGVVGLVVLIACANVAGLLLARASARHTEIAIRAAIGASRARIVQQLLTECVLLGVIGGLAGVAVAWAVLHVLVAIAPEALPHLGRASIDGGVLVFTAAIAVLTGLVSGCVPAWQSSRPDLVEALKATVKGGTEGRGRHRLRAGLVVAQVALAFILLAGTGLLMNSLVRLTTRDLGGDPRDVLTFQVSFAAAASLRGVGVHDGFPLTEVSPIPAQTFDRIWARLRALPGVTSAAAINHTPFTGGGPSLTFTIDGRPLPTTADERLATSARSELVTPGYFSTVRVPLVSGRDFDERDTAAAPWVIVVNEAMADKYWPNENPIGRRLTITLVADDRPREVVGVVRDVRSTPYETASAPVMYTLHTQQPPHVRGPYGSERLNMSFLVGSRDAAALVPALRRAVTDVDPDRPVADIRPLSTYVARELDWPRYLATVLGMFAGVAVLLASTGLYGVMTFGVAQRTREIGIRMALGARRRDVFQLVIRQTVVIVAMGLAIGVAGAFALAHVIEASLWGITPTDTATYAGTAILMALVAVAAAFVPSYRASRVPPTIALRYE